MSTKCRTFAITRDTHIKVMLSSAEKTALHVHAAKQNTSASGIVRTWIRLNCPEVFDLEKQS